MKRIITSLALLVAFSASAAPAPTPTPGAGEPQLWVYCQTNLQVKENVDKLEALWKRAAAAGYTHVLLADSKLAKLQDVPDFYFKHAERAKQIAADLKLTIVPALFSVGYSNDLLWHDPNLAEGLPVKDTPFVVKGGEAVLAPDPAHETPSLQDRKFAFKDDTVTVADGVATMKGDGTHYRFAYSLRLPKYRCFHVSVKIRADNFSAPPEIKAIPQDGDGRGLQWQHLAAPTPEWGERHVVFNTLDHNNVTLLFGVWEQNVKGTLQWKDWKIEEVGLLNVLRRPGAPVVVKGEDGTVYAEGKDYEPIVDPKLGNDPYNGVYQAYHEPPTMKVKDKAKLKDGTRLRVSWYHPSIVYGEQVGICVSEPKTVQLLADQARRVKELFPVPGYMMSHDEVRAMGFDASCENGGGEPGRLLAANVRQCRELLRPATAYVWNDMFDPHHNAVRGPYYLVNGPLTGSWEGLAKDVVIVNWNYGQRDASLKFFADRGHRQIVAGYYDGGMDTAQWKESAAKVKGVVGYMYTTWAHKYDELESFAKAVRGGK